MDKWRITRFCDGRFSTLEDTLVSEIRVSVRIDNQEIAGLMALPEDLDQLAAGYLFNEGYISGPEEISEIETDSETSTVNVRLKRSVPITETSPRPLTIGSSRGVIRTPVSDLNQLPCMDSKVFHRIIDLLAAADRLSRSSQLFVSTGGVHTSGLWMDGQFLWIHDDVGRHNASDKVIGHALLSFWPIPDRAVLLSTGRISCDIVTKALRARIPVLVSRSAPSSIAVRTAAQHGLTMIGFARGNQCNIYTHSERVLM